MVVGLPLPLQSFVAIVLNSHSFAKADMEETHTHTHTEAHARTAGRGQGAHTLTQKHMHGRRDGGRGRLGSRMNNWWVGLHLVLSLFFCQSLSLRLFSFSSSPDSFGWVI